MYTRIENTLSIRARQFYDRVSSTIARMTDDEARSLLERFECPVTDAFLQYLTSCPGISLPSGLPHSNRPIDLMSLTDVHCIVNVNDEPAVTIVIDRPAGAEYLLHSTGAIRYYRDADWQSVYCSSLRMFWEDKALIHESFDGDRTVDRVSVRSLAAATALANQLNLSLIEESSDELNPFSHHNPTFADIPSSVAA